MATETLRPDADVDQLNTTVTGAATRYQALNDANDGTYVAIGSGFTGSAYVTSAIGNMTALAAGYVVTQVRVRIRYAAIATGNPTSVFVSLGDSAGNLLSPDFYASSSGSQNTFTGGWKTTAPDGGAWTEAKVNDLRVRVLDDEHGLTRPYVSAIYVDVETNARPTATGVSPNATTTTGTPTFTWSYADTEGNACQKWRIKVFSTAQVGVGGFDPNTSTPTADSGEQNGAATSWTCTTPLANGQTYRAYVFVYDGYQWNSVAIGGPYAWTTIAISAPAVPEVTLVNHPNSGMIQLNLQDRQNVLDANQASAETAASGWYGPSGGNSGVTRSVGGTWPDGVNGYLATAVGAGASMTVASATPAGGFPVVPGSKYSGMVQVAPVSTARSCRAWLEWYTDANVLISKVNGPLELEISGQFVPCFVTGTAPANAARVVLQLEVLSVGATEQHAFDGNAVVPYALNILKNPLFESDANGDGMADDWATYNWYPSAVDVGPVPYLQTDPRYVKGGNNSQQLGWTANTGQKGISQGGKRLVATWAYTASAWVKLANAGNVRILIDDSLGGGASATVALPANTWTRVSKTLTAPNTASNAFVFISSDSPSNTMWVGHAQLELGTTVSEPVGNKTPWVRGGLLTPQRFQVQRSDDGGTTWVTLTRLLDQYGAVSDLSYLDVYNLSQGLVAYDYEAPRGVPLLYRVRSYAVLTDGSYIASNYSIWKSESLATTGWFLKSTTDPTLNIKLHPHQAEFATTSTERAGTFNALGRRNSIVLSDAIGGESGTLELAFLDQATYDAFEAIRALRETVLLQSAYGDNLYVHLAGDRLQSYMLNGGGIPKRVVTVPFIEVDA